MVPVALSPVPTTRHSGEPKTEAMEAVRAPAGNASPNIVMLGFKTPPVSGCFGTHWSVAMSLRRLLSGLPSREAAH